MKYMIVLILALTTAALAFDYGAIQASKGALQGSIDGTFNEDVVRVAHYLPGYGLHIGARLMFEHYDPDEALEKLTEVLNSLAPTVRGLVDGDVLSVSYEGQPGFAADTYVIVARLRPDDMGSLEIWVDGQPR